MSSHNRTHKKIASRLRSKGKDRSSELDALLDYRRRPKATQEEKEKALHKNHDAGKDKVYRDFIEDSHQTSDRLGNDYSHSAADRLVEIMGEGFVADKEVQHAIATSTGIISLDYALGGGLPSGAVEIYGPESCGKTSLTMTVIRQAQHDKKQVVLCPTEYFDAPYFKNHSVNLDDLVVVRSGTGEKALEALLMMLGSKKDMVVVIDSATALRPRVDEYDSWRGMIYDWLQDACPTMSHGSCVVMVNQVRTVKSADPRRMFAGKTDSAAVKIASTFSTRIELSRMNVTENDYDMVVKIVSNTLKSPSKIFTLPVEKGYGIDGWLDAVRVAAAVGVLRQEGNWYYYGDTMVGHGEVKAALNLMSSSTGTRMKEELVRHVFGRVVGT